jgi:hypothetical protein
MLGWPAKHKLVKLVKACLPPAALPPDTRPLPSVAAYDQLLRRRPVPLQPAKETHHDNPAPSRDDRTSR